MLIFALFKISGNPSVWLSYLDIVTLRLGDAIPNNAADVVTGDSENVSKSLLTDWLCLSAELKREFYILTTSYVSSSSNSKCPLPVQK